MDPHPDLEERMSKKLGVLASAVALALAACSGGSTTTGPTETVAVDISEIDSNTMEMTVDPQSVSAGGVEFDVTNSGELVHELVVFKTDLASDELPTNESGSEVSEDGAGLTLVDEVEDIGAGESKTLTVTLEPGHYVLICNIKGHYQKGLHADFDVS